MTTTVEEKKPKQISTAFRLIQAAFLAILALGVSMAIGDYGEFVKSPISSLSITTMVFGLCGTVMSEAMARRFEK